MVVLIICLIFFFLAFLVSMAGWIWGLVVQFQTSVPWGLACLFIPFAPLVFVVWHWDVAKKPFFLALIGACGMVATAVGGAVAGRGPIRQMMEAHARALPAPSVTVAAPAPAKSAPPSAPVAAPAVARPAVPAVVPPAATARAAKPASGPRPAAKAPAGKSATESFLSAEVVASDGTQTRTVITPRRDGTEEKVVTITAPDGTVKTITTVQDAKGKALQTTVTPPPAP